MFKKKSAQNLCDESLRKRASDKSCASYFLHITY